MRSMSFFFITSLSLTIPLFADTVTYHYRSKLSLKFLQHGVESFIDKSKEEDIDEFIYALDDIIDLAPKNDTNIPKFINNVVDTLDGKIERIKRLQGQDIDQDMILFGSAILAGVMMFFLLMYYAYKRRYRPRADKCADLKQQLLDHGISIDPKTNTVYYPSEDNFDYLDCCNNDLDCCDEALATYFTMQKNNGYLITALWLGALIALFAAWEGTKLIRTGFLSPHADDKYLNQYESMLYVIKEFQEEYPLEEETALRSLFDRFYKHIGRKHRF